MMSKDQISGTAPAYAGLLGYLHPGRRLVFITRRPSREDLQHSLCLASLLGLVAYGELWPFFTSLYLAFSILIVARTASIQYLALVL